MALFVGWLGFLAYMTLKSQKLNQRIIFLAHLLNILKDLNLIHEDKIELTELGQQKLKALSI